MIHLEDTSATGRAVVRPIWFPCMALFAVAHLACGLDSERSVGWSVIREGPADIGFEIVFSIIIIACGDNTVSACGLSKW